MGDTVRKIKEVILRKMLLKAVFAWYRRKPIREDLVLFAYDRDGFTDNMQAVRDELEERGSYAFVNLTGSTIHSSVFRKVRRMIEFTRYYAQAKYVVVADYYMPLYANTKRPETVVVQVWHACGAFKKFGYSILDNPNFGIDAPIAQKYPFHTNYSLVPVSSQEVVAKYVEAFHMEDRKEAVQPLGVPRTDVFFDPDFLRRSAERLYTHMPQARGKKVLLYAPTFRGRVKEAHVENCLDLARLYEALHEKYVLVLKYHPFMADTMDIPQEYRDFAIDLSRKMDISQLLSVADMCISDYSSLVFEYALFEKPMIFYAYDVEDYLDERGFYYPYEEFIPGPLVRTNEQLIEAILHMEEDFDRQKVHQFREKFMSACDGHSTSRIVDAMLQCGE